MPKRSSGGLRSPKDMGLKGMVPSLPKGGKVKKSKEAASPVKSSGISQITRPGKGKGSKAPLD